MSSGASTWLHGQRKTELVEIAERVGLKDYDSLKKAELETALDEHMRANKDKLSQDRTLAAYFKRVNASPGAEASSKDTKEIVVKPKEPKEAKTPKRRVTKAKEELEAEASSAAETASALMRSPAQKLTFASNVPLPPSPAQVASHIDRQAARVRSTLDRVYKQSGVVEYVDTVRDKISTAASIETIAVAIELIGLQPEILPNKYLAVIPASSTLRTPDIPIKATDVFALLTVDFWAPFLLWLATSVVFPMLMAYFFNIGLKAKHGHVKSSSSAIRQHNPATAVAQYDPLTYNVAKALITWLVYARDVTVFSWPSNAVKSRVVYGLPGGYQGIFVATAIGALASFYEAVLKK